MRRNIPNAGVFLFQIINQFPQRRFLLWREVIRKFICAFTAATAAQRNTYAALIAPPAMRTRAPNRPCSANRAVPVKNEMITAV
jgi:hypothetical protein